MPANPIIKEDIIQEQILLAARLLFQQHGYQKVTMDDVARAVGKGRSSLYYYYKNKDEIFDAVMDVEISDFLAELGQAVDKAATAERQIRAFCLMKIKIARKKKGFFNAMEAGMTADEMSQYARKKQVFRKQLLKGESALLRRIITRGIKKKEFPALGAKELETVVFVLLNSLHGLKREMLIENDFSRMEAAVDTLTRMAVQGIKR